ncbi:hypothetical protein DEJ50_17700 [Streptomyces venezuelae]|uniref:PH domain-containing protein n=1 Tax=Streptomyces venezuelae TaxID=54571 RepID=A0A5P2D5L4_STRVZ|nr:hypothetical protein [Streptomyces venezuelae]QES49368.1 hypothetical protein DEJ50_17700 [Streptomyces venezuelae]
MERGCEVPGPDEADEPPEPVVYDAHWRGERRTAIGVAALLLALLLVVDAGLGRLTVVRGLAWTGLAFLLFVVLLPPRVSAAPGRLSSRGLFTRRTVRTDRLISVRWVDGVAQRMIVCDDDGHHVEVDPNVMVRNPALWRRFDRDARGSLERGLLLCGGTAIAQLAGRVGLRETDESPSPGETRPVS